MLRHHRRSHLLRVGLLLLVLFPAWLWLRIGLAEAARPNVVVIQTDDQSSRTLRATFRGLDGRTRRVMPKTQDLIARQGTEFTRYYATQPVCGPSRAALLTGRYAHTTGLKRNAGPTGGWSGWQRLPLLRDNLAVTLQASGYRTIHVGKFTNNFVTAGGGPEATVPPGWDRWHTMSYGSQLYYYGYRLNRNGLLDGPLGATGYDSRRNDTDPVSCTAARLLAPVPDPNCNNATDVYSRTAVDEIRTAGDQPFYLQLDYNTPHGDHRPPSGPEPAPRHYDTTFGNGAPRTPAFDEPDIRDKPAWLKRTVPRLTAAEIREINVRWRKELEALRDVDDGVAAMIEALRETGKLGNTYIVFLSDNGQFHGEHRFSGAKFLPYERASRVPMLVRGPGIPRGRRTAELAGNVDIAPTVLDLTRIPGAGRLDGRSLRPFWTRPKRRTARPLFIESWIGSSGIDDDESPSVSQVASVSVTAPPLDYRGVRVGRYKYVEYASGDRELYDLARDPHELTNRVSAPRYRRPVARLATILRQRKDCVGAACRQPVRPLPKPGR